MTDSSPSSVVGLLQENQDGSWILNPRSTYPLTVAGIDSAEVQWLKENLDHICEDYSRRQMQEIGYFLLGTTFAWKELLEYTAIYKPVFDSALENHKKLSELDTASPEEEQGMLLELAEKAWENVPLRLVEDFDLALDPGLPRDTLERYGKWPLAEYVVGIQSKKRTRTARKQRWVRERMQHLAQVGLAEEINDGVFRMSPLPEELKDLDIIAFEKAERNALTIAGLLSQTYVGGYANRKHLDWTQEAGFDTWEIMNDDPCPVCQAAIGRKKRFKQPELIRLPVHLGCDCAYFSVR